MVHGVVRKCSCEGAGIFLNVSLSVDVHLCVFLAISQCAVYQCMPCAYWFLLGMVLKAA